MFVDGEAGGRRWRRWLEQRGDVGGAAVVDGRQRWGMGVCRPAARGQGDGGGSGSGSSGGSGSGSSGGKRLQALGLRGVCCKREREREARSGRGR